MARRAIARIVRTDWAALTPPAISVGRFDGLDGMLARGWVRDPAAPETSASVEFVIDDKVVHTTQASFVRSDIVEAGLGSGHAGFLAELPLRLTWGKPVRVHARLRGTQLELENSPQTAAVPDEIGRWLLRRGRVTGSFLHKLRARLHKAVGSRRLSILMPVRDGTTQWLRDALESVLAQWCPAWELLCIDGATASSAAREVLAEYAARDARVRVVEGDGGGSIAGAMNIGIAAADGEYLTFLDQDHILEPDAVYHLLQASRSGAELVYGDELITTEDTEVIVQAIARPAFTWDFYLCHPYFVHPICVRTDVARAIGGWNSGMSIAADVDFVLRILEQSDAVAHVPAILYRRRPHGVTSGHPMQEDARTATRGAIDRHLERIAPGASCADFGPSDHHQIDFPDDGGMVLVVILTRNRLDLLHPCVQSIRATTQKNQVQLCIVDHESDDPSTLAYLASLEPDCMVLKYHGPFNFAKMNNNAIEAVKTMRGGLPPYILFANNDLEAIRSGWLERMRSLAGRPDVGAVGATLLYANDLVQHAGVIIGMHGAADHAHKFARYETPDHRREPGYLSSLVSTREYSAVTAACIMMRSEVFQGIGGFDERFAVGFNDTDLCLRIGALGLKILNDGATALHHYESATRSVTKQLWHPKDDRLLKTRWAAMLQAGDPFYSPLFSIDGLDHYVVRYKARQVAARVRPGPPKLASPGQRAGPPFDGPAQASPADPTSREARQERGNVSGEAGEMPSTIPLNGDIAALGGRASRATPGVSPTLIDLRRGSLAAFLEVSQHVHEIGHRGDEALPGSRSLVLASYKLQEIRDYRGALQRWFGALRVGGRLVVIVPHAFLRDRRNAPPSPWSEHQLRLYTPRSLLDEIEEALVPNSYRVRWAGDCDAGYDYSLDRLVAPVGEHHVAVVLEKIALPVWGLEDPPSGDPAGPPFAFDAPRTRSERVEPVPSRRILVLKLDHLGDFIMGVPAMQRLRAAFPAAEITLVAGSWNQAIAAELGLFDRILTFDAYPRNSSEEEPDPRGRLALFDALVDDAYDLAIDLRTDPDTRIFLKNVKAGIRAGLGSRTAFPHLDIFLPVDQARYEYEPAEVMTIGPDAFAYQRDSCTSSRFHIACQGDRVGEDSAIIWGPYRRLRQGQYIFQPFVALDATGSGAVRCDVGLDRESVVQELLPDSGELSLSFYNETDDAEFEFRFWAVGDERVRNFQFFGGKLIRQGAAGVLHQSEYGSLLVELVAMRVTREGVLRDRNGAT